MQGENAANGRQNHDDLLYINQSAQNVVIVGAIGWQLTDYWN